MRKVLLIIFMLALWHYSYAGIVKGKVISSDTSEELIGVTVMVKGTSIGTITDVNGDFSINVSDENSVLTFSYIGFKIQEIPVAGMDVINVKLEPDVEELEGVVVTALGIKRSEKALGYAVQKVGGDLVSDVKEPDVMNSLAGKVAGLSVIQSDGAIGGGGSRVVLRGETSLAGNNDPLYIINGVQGDANDIASDDIESISVLKGPAAAALYGAKAGGGVIIITSKSANKNKGMEVSVNSSTMFQTPLVLPEYQNVWGMGDSYGYSYYDGNGGGENDDTEYSWGPAFDGELHNQFNGYKAWLPNTDDVKNFYEIGHILTNNISVTNTSDKGSFRFSYTNTDQKGIMPNNGLNKSVFAFNSVYNVIDGLKITPNLSFIRNVCDNDRTFDVRFIPRGVDFSALEDYWVPGMEDEQQMNYRRSANNPYFVLYACPDSYKDTKAIANVAVSYEFLNHWSAMGRVAVDFLNHQYEDKRAKSYFVKDSPKDLTGFYETGYHNTWNLTSDFLISYNDKFFNALNAKLSFGGTHYKNEYKELYASTYNLKYTGIYNLGNREDYLEDLYDYKSEKQENSLYGFLNLDYQGKVFLDLTYREDWSSTLISTADNFSYPSATLSAICSDIFELPDFISFAKIRASVAQVGNSIPSAYYTIEEKKTYSESNGLSTLDVSDTETDPYLKPELITGYEAGLDIRFFNNRLGLDGSVYYSLATNNILCVEQSATSGGETSRTINAGKVSSKGIEITLNATPVKIKNFKWDFMVNWSMDRTYVDELVADDPTFTKTQAVNSFLSIIDQKGQRRGEFYGADFERDPDGNRIYTSTGDTQQTDDTELGNYNPDWMGSINNTFTYKNLSLSCLFDLRYGGLIYNETERKLNMYGLSKATLLDGRDNVVPDGVYETDDGTYAPLSDLDIGVSGEQYWTSEMAESVPGCVLEDDTYLKLREVRIGYSFPKTLLGKTFIKSASVAFVGRNIAVWSNIKHIDPETYGIATDENDFGEDTKVPGYANSNLPSVRSFGFSVSCKF